MIKRIVTSFGLLLLLGISSSGDAQAQPRGISGKWAGTGVNDGGGQFAEPLEITEHEDGTLTGTGNGAPGKEMKILNGERVMAGLYQWEYATKTHRWRVRGTVKGKSLVLDYTCTWKEDGKVKGGTGTIVMTKVPRAEALDKKDADAITPLHHIRWAEGTPGESSRFTSIDLTPDGRYFLASRAAHKTRVWNTKTGELVRELPGYIARLSQDGTQVIRTGGISGVNDFHVHDLATGKELREFDAQVQIWNFGLPRFGTRLWLVSPQGGQVWDWSTGKKLCDFPWTGSDRFGHTPDLRHVFLQVGGKPPLLVLDTETGKPVEDVHKQLRDLARFPTTLTADGKRMLTADDKTPIKVYDVATGKEFPPLEGKPTTHYAISLADGRRVLAAGNERKTFGLWDVETGRLLTTLRFPEEIDGSWNYRLSHDGGYAVVCSTDSVYVFRLPSSVKKDAK